MRHPVRNRLVLQVAIAGLLLLVAAAGAEHTRVYSDEELATMPAPGPNPFLSFLPLGADVDWQYWRDRMDYEVRLRAARLPVPRRIINLAEVEPNDTLGTAQPIPGFGTASGEDPAADVTGTISGGGDVDCFSIALDPGDVVGASAGVSLVELYEPGGELQMGSGQDASFLYPAANTLPSGGAVLDFVTYSAGNHVVCVQGGGAYTLFVRAFRPLEKSPKQILFVDFDGATIDPGIFGGPPGPVALSPLSSFLAGWGLGPGDESAVISAILAAVDENLRADLMLASNPLFDVEIRNSRDDPDPFGQANVSRLIVGGTIPQFGINTIGIAQSIDPGNFEAAESAVILLDLLSAPAVNPNSLNQFPLGGGATIFDLVGVGVGNIVAHEAGHYLGNWHTEQFALSSMPAIMDQGGNLAGTVGVGSDGIFGTADDVDTDFIPDDFVSTEGFTGVEHTDEKTAFGLSAGEIFSDGFESGDTSAW